MSERDLSGTPYHSNGSGPAPSGAQVTIHTPNGPVAGTMVGGYVTPNK